MGSQLLSIFSSRLHKSRSIKMFKLCCLLLVVYMVAAEETIMEKRHYHGRGRGSYGRGYHGYNRPYYNNNYYRPPFNGGGFNNNNNNHLASFLAGLAAGGVAGATLTQLAQALAALN